MSKPRFTITLGRSGQVVKRGERVSENAHGRADTGAMNGSKRSMGERLGSSANGPFISRNKRQRGDGVNWSPGHNTYQKNNWSPGHNGVHDNNYYSSRIGRNDLRLKLMRKNLKHIRRAVEERRYMERLEKQSKPTQPSASRSMLRQRPEPKGSRFPRQIPPTERSRSPDRVLKASRGGLSQSGNFDDLRQVSSVRAPDASRAGWFLSNDVGTSRPTGFTSLAMKGPAETLKSVTQLAPMSGIGLQSSHGVEESLTVSGLLQSLGLGKYNIHFRAEEVDMTALKQMGDKDLKEMGIPMGPRKKILLALRPVQNSSRHNFNL